MVVYVEVKELRVRKGKKGWAGWISKTEDERSKLQRRTLRPGGSRAWVKYDQEGELESARNAGGGGGGQGNSIGVQENKNKFQVLAQIGETATEEESNHEERTQEKAWKARREFHARVGAFPSGKIVQRPVEKKLLVAGRTSED